MTSDTVLCLVRQKKEKDYQKYLADFEKERRKEQEELRRRLAVIQPREKINDELMCR